MMQWFNRYPECREVIVHLKTDKSIKGVLWQRRRGYLVLRNAVLLRPRGESVAMDGDAVIAADNVEFLQVVGQ